ncbi:MAG TPA: hypothetical protein VGD05_13825, partial [Pyrinomonadaceae bacterium]
QRRSDRQRTIDRNQWETIRQTRSSQYNQYWRQQQQISQQSARLLQQQRRVNQYRYQQRYLNRIRQDQLRLQQSRYNDNLSYDYRYNRGGSYYYTSQYGAQMLRQAVEYGYEEGFRAGQSDREDRWDYDYQNSYGYQDASYGYNSYNVDQSEYNYYFREGFRRGYEDGYYSRNRYGRYNNGGYSILGNILQGIFSAILFND